MNEETKTAVVQATVNAMREVMDDGAVDIEDHISDHTVSANSDGHRAWATVDFSGETPEHYEDNQG